MGRNLTVVSDAVKNPTPWKEPASTDKFNRGGVMAAVGRHPAGSAYAKDPATVLVERLQEGRNDTLRNRLRAIHTQLIAELESELRGMLAQHETEALLLDYRLEGNTLEGLGDLADDEVIANAWTRLNEELFDL